MAEQIKRKDFGAGQGATPSHSRRYGEESQHRPRQKTPIYVSLFTKQATSAEACPPRATNTGRGRSTQCPRRGTGGLWAMQMACAWCAFCFCCCCFFFFFCFVFSCV